MQIYLWSPSKNHTPMDMQRSFEKKYRKKLRKCQQYEMKISIQIKKKIFRWNFADGDALLLFGFVSGQWHRAPLSARTRVWSPWALWVCFGWDTRWTVGELSWHVNACRCRCTSVMRQSPPASDWHHHRSSGQLNDIVSHTANVRGDPATGGQLEIWKLMLILMFFQCWRLCDVRHAELWVLRGRTK